MKLSAVDILIVKKAFLDLYHTHILVFRNWDTAISELSMLEPLMLGLLIYHLVMSKL